MATVAGVPAYAASKGGVLAFSRQLALDYAVDFIRVNALIVGSVDTRMTRAGIDAAGGADKLGLSYDRNVIARIADPAEIAARNRFSAVGGIVLRHRLRLRRRWRHDGPAVLTVGAFGGTA